MLLFSLVICNFCYFQAAEQSLRVGLWDFLLTLSGSDLPLRNVDDLAQMLGPYRGTVYSGYSQTVGWGNYHKWKGDIFTEV